MFYAFHIETVHNDVALHVKACLCTLISLNHDVDEDAIHKVRSLFFLLLKPTYHVCGFPIPNNT